MTTPKNPTNREYAGEHATANLAAATIPNPSFDNVALPEWSSYENRVCVMAGTGPEFTQGGGRD